MGGPCASGPFLSMAKAGSFGAIILAAGASTRMGRPKQALLVGGRPMVVRAAEAALAAGAWPVVVVLGAHATVLRPLLARQPVLTIENSAWAEGMASSIRTGIGVLQQFSRTLEAVLLAVCDQPGFSAEVIGQLVAARQATGRPIAAARYGGRQGVPALFGQDYFAVLAALTGEAGARSLLNDQADRVAAVDLPQLAEDLDTPQDYARLGSEAPNP